MACETCGAPSGYVAGWHLSACIESKMEFHKKIKELRAELQQYKQDAERYQKIKAAAYVGINQHLKCMWVVRGLFEIEGKGLDEAVDAMKREVK